MRKIILYSICLISFFCIGQNISPVIKGKAQTHYGSIPVFDVDKIKLNESTITILQKQISDFIGTYNKVQEICSDRCIDQEKGYKFLSDYYGLNTVEIELRTTLNTVFPKTNYCGYDITPSNHFRERNSVTLSFYDGDILKIFLNKLPVNKHTPITISYPNEEKDTETRIIYHPNGNVKALYSYHSDYPVSELLGFYGIYNLKGTPIKEMFLKDEFKNEYIPFNFESDGKILIGMSLKELNCGREKRKVKPPIIKKLYDTNYGNLWVANYTVTLKDKNLSKEEREKTIENYMVVIRDEDEKVLVNEKMDRCYQTIYDTGETFKLYDDDSEILKEQTVEQLEKETNKVIIVVKKIPYAPKDFIIKEYDEYPKFELKDFILPYKMRFFTNEFKRVTSKLNFVEYKNSRMESFSINSGFVINPDKSNTYNIFESGIVLKYNFKNFRFSKDKEFSRYNEPYNKIRLDEKAISLIFPKKIIQAFDIEKNKPKKNKSVEFLIEEVLYVDETLGEEKYFEVLLRGKFADDVIVKNVTLGKEFQYDFRMKSKENILEMYIDDNLLVSKTFRN